MKLSELISEFLDDQICKGNSDKTVEYYSFNLNNFLEFSGDIYSQSLSVTLARSYQKYLMSKVSNSTTLQTYIRSLRAFLNWCYDNEYISEDICRKFKLPKAKISEPDLLTDEELAKVFAVCDGNDFYSLRNRLILALMLDAGLRRGEVIGALRCNLHLLDRCLIVTGKGNKQRAVAFGLETERLLYAYLAVRPDSPYLIVSLSNTGEVSQMTVFAIKDLFRKLREKSGIMRLHPHLLRHGYATRYIENGGNMFSLQLLLGHTSLNMVKRYVHLARFFTG